jgi:hypothetical protein
LLERMDGRQLRMGWDTRAGGGAFRRPGRVLLETGGVEQSVVLEGKGARSILLGGWGGGTRWGEFYYEGGEGGASH